MNYDPNDLLPRVGEMVDDVLVPLKSMSKNQIQGFVLDWLERMKEYPAPERYVYFKQMEEAIKKAIEVLKEQAFNAAGDRFGGEKSGKILGHDVKLSYPSKWQYSIAVTRLELQQKLAMESLQAQERASGTATKIDSRGIISVTLQP